MADNGVLYVMSSVICGIVKIGRTTTNNYEERMRKLESDGYSNLTGLKRVFAIIVDDAKGKEHLLHEVFRGCRVGTSELFAVDIDLVVQLLSAFDGTQLYPSPQVESKSQVFENAAEGYERRRNRRWVPDGTYWITRKFRGSNEYSRVMMHVEGGKYIIPEGQIVDSSEAKGIPERVHAERASTVDVNGRVIRDIVFNSPSAAACFALGTSVSGWDVWEDVFGRKISVFRSDTVDD